MANLTQFLHHENARLRIEVRALRAENRRLKKQLESQRIKDQIESLRRSRLRRLKDYIKQQRAELLDRK